MRFYGVILAVWLWLAGGFPAQAGVARITAPAAGATLRGVVELRGTSQVQGFIGAELAYAYVGDETWFLIAQSSQPVTAGVLAVWDTTRIADGDYRLRLLVQRGADAPLEVIVEGLHVRNDVSVTAQPPAATLAPLGLLATPTPLPPNPAQIGAWRLGAAATQGVVITLFIFAVMGLYALARRAARGG